MTLLVWEALGHSCGLDFDLLISEHHSSSAVITEHTVEDGVDLTDHVRPDRARLTLEVLTTNHPIAPSLVSWSILLPDGSPAETPFNPLTPLTASGAVRKQFSDAKFSGGVTTLADKLPAALSPITRQIPTKVNGLATPFTPVTVTPAEFRTFTYLLAMGSSPQAISRTERLVSVYEQLDDLCATGTPVTVTTDLKTYPSMLIQSVSAPVGVDDSIHFTLSLIQLRIAQTASTTVTKVLVKPAQKRAVAATPTVTTPARTLSDRHTGKSSALSAQIDAGTGAGPRAD